MKRVNKIVKITMYYFLKAQSQGKLYRKFSVDKNVGQDSEVKKREENGDKLFLNATIKVTVYFKLGDLGSSSFNFM